MKVRSRTEEARKRRLENIKKEIQRQPFILRMVLFGLCCIPVGLHLKFQRSLFQCPEEECPPNKWFRFHVNNWAYPNRAYMEIILIMHLEAYIQLWVLFIPDFHKKIRKSIESLKQYFEGWKYTTLEISRELTNIEIDRIPMESVENL